MLAFGRTLIYVVEIEIEIEITIGLTVWNFVQDLRNVYVRLILVHPVRILDNHALYKSTHLLDRTNPFPGQKSYKITKSNFSLFMFMLRYGTFQFMSAFDKFCLFNIVLTAWLVKRLINGLFLC